MNGAERSSRLQSALRFVRGVSRSVRNGDLFPAAGRRAPRPAPGGSTDGNGLLATGIGNFVETVHTVPVPALERPVEILHLTDVHLRADDAWTAALAERIRAIRCDLVALTGDLVTLGWTTGALDRFLGALPDAPLGRFAVIGNWDAWAGLPPDDLARRFAEPGIRLLHNGAADVGPISVAGTDDLLSGSPDVERALEALPLDRPAVVLTHSPGLFPRLARPPVRLVLAGHSHAGQVRVPGLGAMWVPKATGPYVAGWYEENGSWLFVSRGVGWSIAPVRLGCSPELARIRLVPA